MKPKLSDVLSHAVLLLGAAIMLFGLKKAGSLAAGAEMAKTAIDSGVAKARFLT